MTEPRLVVGVDLGGTKTSAAVVAPDGEVGPVVTIPTPSAVSPDTVLDAVASAVRAAVTAAAIGTVSTASRAATLAEDFGSARRGLRLPPPRTSVPVPDALAGAVPDALAGALADTLAGDLLDTRPDALADPPPGLIGVGIGTAGAVNAASGTIVSATDTVRGWVGTDLVAGVRARLGDIAVEVRNDVDAHALGEAWRGAAASASTFLMVAAGTGIGGAVVVDGRLRTGAHHVAGEMGHVPAPGADGLRCPCGRTGHLEALAAGPAIHRGYLARGGSPEASDTRAVFDRARQGDRAALDAIDAAASGLARGVAGIVTTLDPELVVVGGGLAEAGPLWWRPFEDTLRAELIDVLAGIPVVPAAAGQSAAIIGAAGAVYDAQPAPEPHLHLVEEA